MTDLLVATGVAGAGVLASYAFVLFDAAGGFPLAARPAGYLASPYWLGLPRATVGALVGLQVLALVGYVAWLFHVAAHPPTRGLLRDARARFGLTLGFLGASALWPFAAYELVRARERATATLGWALASSACLWAAAGCVIALLAGTVEARYESPVPVLGMLALALVVVLVDGVGWAATAIFDAVHQPPAAAP